MKNEEVFECTVTLSQLFDKLNYIHNKMEDHFRSLQTEIASLRYELKDEIEGVKNTIKDMEKSIEAAWDAIKDIQEEMKANSDIRKQIWIVRKLRLPKSGKRSRNLMATAMKSKI